MVLPERSSLDMKKGDIIYRAALVWNACLDEVARLNAAAPQPSDDVARDAARYRWLRHMTTNERIYIVQQAYDKTMDDLLDESMAGVGNE